MGLMNSGRVNIVITDRVLRFTYHKNPSINELVTYGEADLSEGILDEGAIVDKDAFQKVVSKLVQQHKWKRKMLYFCVPDDTVVIRQLQIPASLSKDETLGYIKTQIGNSIYLPFTNPAIAVDSLAINEANRDILLLAYPKDKIQAFEEVFAGAGLKPVAADLTSLSIYRYYYYQQHDGEKDHVLLINWNQDALVLTAFHNHKAVFTRYMKMEEENQANSEEVAIRTINEFMIEINRIIDFYRFSITKGEASINLLLLTGDFPFIKQVKTILAENQTMPIHHFPEGRLPSRYLDVLGLALKRDM